ncbi:MAG TPA: hypothetical protein VE734_04220 [Terriglobales bacterium]|jgi:hypothetical protein|nr:hypothetical protein [Terriglobales bacterium]
MTDVAQEVPGVVAFAMPVIPVKAQSVLARGSQVSEADWARSARGAGLERRGERTRRAGTNHAQVGEAVVTAAPMSTPVPAASRTWTDFGSALPDMEGIVRRLFRERRGTLST